MSEKNPPLFTRNSLIITSKIITIYCLFMAVVALVPVFTNPVSANPMMPENHYNPVLFQALIHFVLFLSSLFVMIKKKYSWLYAIPVAVVLLLLHFYYDEIAVWVWENL